MREVQTHKTRILIKTIVLAILVWAVYWNSLHNPFAFDDWHVIPGNPAVRGPANIPSFFVDTSKFSILVGNQGYRPLFLTSMALCWWLGAGSTLPFHLVSVTLHMGNALLLFLIFRRVFSKQSDPVGGLASPQSEWAAFASASIFALHPLASESVNYISSQSVPLAALFYLLSFYLFVLVYGNEIPLSGGKWVRLAGSYACYFLALLSKVIAISLPLNLILWDLIFGKSSNHGTGSLWGRYGRRVTKHLPYLGISICYLLIRKAVSRAPFGADRQVRSIFVHYLTQTKAMVFYYLKLAFIPLGLNVDAEYALSTSILDAQVVFSIVILIGIGCLLFLFRQQKNVLFWSLWFPSCLLLTTYVVILGQVVNEHRAYLSLAGFCAVVGLLLFKLWDAFPLQISDFSIGRRSGKALTTALILLILLGLGYETRARNEVWSSQLTLWKDAALHGGTWRAHMNYGLALEGKRRAKEALFQFEEAVKLGPYAFAHLNLGHAHVKRGNYEKGIAHLRTAVRLWPSLPEAHLYLGYGLQRQGDMEEAERAFRHAIALRPNYLKGYRYLAQFYEAQGKLDDAIATLEQLHELDPGLAWASNRIRLLEKRKELGVGVSVSALFNEAFAHQKNGRTEQAIERYEQLLKMAPNHRQGTFNLAYAYLQGQTASDWFRSAILFKKVLEIDSQYAEAIHHLASAYWKLEQKDEAVKYDSLYLQRGRDADLKRRSEERVAAARGQ